MSANVVLGGPNGPQLEEVCSLAKKAEIIAREAPGATFYCCGSLDETFNGGSIKIVRFERDTPFIELERAIWATVYPEVHPKDLPTWLAIPWHNVCEEEHSRVRMCWLLDTCEIAVRWTAALALAEAEHHPGGLPPKLSVEVGKRIRDPSFRTWLDVLKLVEPCLPVDGWVVHDIREWCRRLRGLATEPPKGVGGGADSESLLDLRAAVERVGSVSREAAYRLVDDHLPTLLEILGGVRDLIKGADILADGLRLHGCKPEPVEPATRGAATVRGVRVVRRDDSEERELVLDPLLFAGPGQPSEEASTGSSSAYVHPVHVFARAGAKNRLQYTSLGGMRFLTERFNPDGYRRLSLSGVDERQTFVHEARRVANEFVGREEELKIVRGWLDARSTGGQKARVGWIGGNAGMGKSTLMGKVVTEWVERSDENEKALHFHRFQEGDHRCNRRSFLKTLRDALWSFPPMKSITAEPSTEVDEGGPLEEDVRQRLRRLHSIGEGAAQAPPIFWVFVDGIDEIAKVDRAFPLFLRGLADAGGAWLVAGRPDGDLPGIFGSAGGESLFAGGQEDGLPKMTERDIRDMLIKGLDLYRYALLKRDQDADTRISNAFVDVVVARADGLPIYVHHVIEDVRSGILDVQGGEDKLPPSLEAYYDLALDRLGVTATSLDLARILALLASVRSPLDHDGLAALLAVHDLRPPEVDDALRERVGAALRAGASLLRRASSPESEEAWALYHQSFRERFLLGPKTVPMVHTARRVLMLAANEWALQGAPALGALRAHLFRWGTYYAVEWGGPAGVDGAVRRLTDFAYLQLRTASLPASDCTELAKEYLVVLAKLHGTPMASSFGVWADFMRERVHLLRRGDPEWPANRILLQVAVEHADESPVTKSAETWLEGGGCDWVWLRVAEWLRPPIVGTSGLVDEFAGHADSVIGAVPLPGGRVASWSRDGALLVWESVELPPIRLVGHIDQVNGVLALADGRILSWSLDSTLRLWGLDGKQLAVLNGHARQVNGALELRSGGILSWSDDGTIRLWRTDGASIAETLVHAGGVAGVAVLSEERVFSSAGVGYLRTRSGDHEPVHELSEADSPVVGATLFADGRLLSWSRNGSMRIWDQPGRISQVIHGHQGGVLGVRLLLDGSFLSWGEDGQIVRWGQDGVVQRRLVGHSGPVLGVVVLADGRLASWGGSSRVRVWADDGSSVAVQDEHRWGVAGVHVLQDGRLATWSEDGWIRVWSQDFALISAVEAHSDLINGVALLPGMRMLSWSDDKKIRVWDASSFPAPAARESQGLYSSQSDIHSALLLDEGRILAWRWEEGAVLQLLDRHGLLLAELKGHQQRIEGARQLSDGRILSWSWDQTIRMWTSHGELITQICGHDDGVLGVIALSDGRILSWSWDGGLRLWSEVGEPVADLRGHTEWVQGAIELTDGRLLSWSSNGTAYIGSLRLWSSSGEPLVELLGHADAVRGAKELPDGRLLSWYWDSSLRLWSGGGSLLAIVDGSEVDDSGIGRVTVLPDGKIIVQSRDRRLYRWDGRGDRLVGIGLEAAVHDVLARHPRLFSVACTVPGVLATDWRNDEARVLINESVCRWHSRDACEIQALDPDGVVHVTSEDALGLPRVSIIHLYHGNRRVTFEEAAAILKAASLHPPSPES